MLIRRLIFTLTLILLTAGFAQATVDVYVSDLNIYASKKFNNFKAEISARYGISGSRFDVMLKKVDSPGDLAVALWIGTKSQKSIDDVVKKLRLHRGKGWGVVAKEMGIKPGSAAFKELKAGTIKWHPKDFDEVVNGNKKNEKAKEIKSEKEIEREQKMREALERKEKKRQERDKKKGY